MTTPYSCKPIYRFCPHCRNKAWIEPDHDLHNCLSGVDSVSINGVHVISDFITEDEERQLVSVIDTRVPWVDSQEGRRKQDYGPKVNFLKRKASLGEFRGMPNYANGLVRRMRTSYPDIMNDFVPVEYCILEYTPERKSYIRPHYDDFWIWGDRLITINLLSETTLRLTKEFRIPPYEIAIVMPPRSLIVVRGEARYDWHHSISKYDIKSRRIAMTWREFGEEIIEENEYRGFVSQVTTIASQSITD